MYKPILVMTPHVSLARKEEEGDTLLIDVSYTRYTRPLYESRMRKKEASLLILVYTRPVYEAPIYTQPYTVLTQPAHTTPNDTHKHR